MQHATTASTHPTAPAAEPQARAYRTARFLHWLHDDQAGYAEIVAGATDPHDPSKIALLMHTRRFLYLDPERPDLYHQAAAYVDALAAKYGNVYTGVRLYDRRARDENKRSEAYTKPGRVIFIDDAPDAPALPYTVAIRTSEHSLHAYYKADQPVTKDDARRAAAALGGDPSGVDLTQLVRFPGTLNTKRGGQWRITTAPSTRTIYPLDQLRATFPAVAPAHKGSGEITDLAWPAVEKHLSNIAALLASGRAQRIKPDTQTGRILAGEMLIFSVHNRQDDSRSMNGYVLGNGFYLRGFPDAEIAAVMMHHYRTWGVERDKGTAWCKADICRALARMHSEKPGVVQAPSRYTANAPAAQLVEQPAASRARHDRPRQLDPLMLFGRYKADPALCALSRKPRAAALDISTATLDRLDQALRAEGLITIERPGRGLPGRVLVLGGVINIAADGVLSAPDAPIADLSIETAQTDDRGPQCKGETHPPPETPQPSAAAPAPRSLAEAVRLAFDQVRVNPNTGERQRITRKRLLLALAECWPHPTPAARLDQVIADERTRRRCADTVADMATMNPPTLRAQIRLMERLGDKSREHGTNLYRFADWAARELRRELASRPAEPGRKPRKNCEALPDPRKAAERQQAELWQVADRGLELVRAERRGGGTARGVSPQTPAPAGADDPNVPNVGRLLATLRARLAQRQAVAQ